ncbi:MAG: aldo/keto reductase [Deltaproteobacteria bacterium]|nr:aldo/keto reductase [Deltaproteobacteria bacterium]
MRYRTLGKTGLEVSSICMGTMSFGGDANRETATAMVGAARDAGINFFDCADVYNKGAAEEILGAAIADVRDQVVIATKAYFPTDKDVNARGSSRYHLVRAVEDSLRRLGTDRIDLFYLHRFDDKTDLEDTMRTLDDLVSAGKILYPAVSNFSAWQVSKALGICARRGYAPPVCVQPMYNLVKRQAEVEILPMAMSEGLGVVSYSPLGGGLLSGRYGVVRRPKEGRLIDNQMYVTRYGDSHYFEVAEQFSALAAKHGLEPVTLAIAWVKSRPGITAPIIGGRDLEQIRPALAAAELELDEELAGEVAALWPAPPPATDRNEEQSSFNYSSTLSKS